MGRVIFKEKMLKYAVGIFLLAGIYTSCLGLKDPGISQFEYSLTSAGMVTLSGNVDEDLAGADGYPYKVTLHFSKDPYETTTVIYAEILVRKPYGKWHVKEMTINWDGGSKILMENKTFLINEDRYRYGNGWYLIPSFAWGLRFARVNFEKIFKGKMHGDQFPAKILMKYSFDDEPESEQEFEFIVTTRKWKFVDLWSP
jgi:hypothetical protein